jgi:hypothetical protein
MFCCLLCIVFLFCVVEAETEEEKGTEAEIEEEKGTEAETEEQLTKREQG